MAAQLFLPPYCPALDANGIIVPGAKLYFYLSGTTTLAPVYADDNLSTPLSNPVEANSAGVWPTIYLSADVTYRNVLTDGEGETLNEVDPYNPGADNVQDYLDELSAGLAKRQYIIDLSNDINASVVPAPVMQFETAGYYAAGDGGAALWTRSATNPSHTAKRQSQDGAWWVLASKSVRPEQLGAKGDGATDDTAAITQAISFADVVQFGAKTYNHTGLVVNRQCYMRGVSRNKTVLRCTVATGIAISLAQSPFNLSDMTVDRSVAATAGYGVATLQDGFGTIERLIIQNHWVGLQLNSTADSIARDITSQFNYSNGVDLVTSATMPACQWKMYGFISQMNNGYGYNFYAAAHSSGPYQTGPVGINIGSYANTAGGFIFSGQANTAWNDVNLIHPYSSFDNTLGMAFYNPGANNQLIDVFVEAVGNVATGRTMSTAATNTGAGILFDLGGTAESYILISGKVQYCSNQGLAVSAASGLRKLQLSGFLARDNGKALSQRFGIEIQSTNIRTQMTNVVSSNIASTNQTHGLATNATTAAKTWIWGADMANNATAASNVASGSFGAWNVAT